MTINYTFMGMRDGAIGFSTDLVGSLIGLACTAAQVPYRMCTSEHRWDDICNDFWSNGENISYQLQYMLGGEEFLERIKNKTHPAYRHAYNSTLLGSNLLSIAPLATSMALKAPKYLKTGYSVLRNWRTHMVLAKQTCQQTPAFIKYALGLGKKPGYAQILEERKNVFPKNPKDLCPGAVRDRKGYIYTSDKIRIKPEKHILESGEIYNPRHHGQHYHIEVRTNASKSWNNKKYKYYIKPEGYQEGRSFAVCEVLGSSQ